MKNLIILLGCMILLSACANPEKAIFNPMTAASETGVDVSVLQPLGTAQGTDSLVVYNSGELEGSRIGEVEFSKNEAEWLNGVAGFTAPTAAQIDAVSAASGGIFKGNVDIGDADTSTEERSLEIGKGRTGNGTSYLDLIGDITYPFFGFRMQRGDTGANADSLLIHKGTGDLKVYTQEAGDIKFYTDYVFRGQFPAIGGFSLSSGTSIDEFSTDGTFAGDSDDAVPTEKAIKTYVDAKDVLSFNSYSAAQTLTAATHNAGIVQMTVAGELTMWDCEAANVGEYIGLWARDAEKIEIVPASGDHFVLFDGTALDANDELDMAVAAGTKVSLLCTADDAWSVYTETATSTDGGVAD